MTISTLKILDETVTEVALAVYQAMSGFNWSAIRYVAKFTPTADVWSSDYDLLDDHGNVIGTEWPSVPESHAINKVALRHWQLTQDHGQPRWYKMIVTVERKGKFNVEFEYKDDYKEGDIMARG